MKKSKPKKSKSKYLKPISLWPLKPEDALRAFMQVDPKKVKKKIKGHLALSSAYFRKSFL